MFAAGRNAVFPYISMVDRERGANYAVGMYRSVSQFNDMRA